MSKLRPIGNLLSRLAALVLLSACSTFQPSAEMPLDNAAQLRWNSFLATADQTAQPEVLDGSLRFGPEEQTTRVTYTLWSNGFAPLRLDVQAGVGVVAANARVADNNIMLFVPQDNRAYFGADTAEQSLNVLGLPLPLSVGQLALFLHGNYAAALDFPQSANFSIQADGYEYAIGSGSTRSYLRLDELGRPVAWRIPNLWQVSFAYDAASGRVRRIDAIRLNEDFSAILLVRNRQNVSPFAEVDLDLDLPPGVNIYLLDAPR